MCAVHYLCHDVFFMLCCITYVMMYFVCCDVLRMSLCIFYVVMYYVCHNVFFMVWCIMYVMAYFLCCDVLHLSWHIAWVVTIFYVMMYCMCRDLFCMLWFDRCRNIFYMLRCILYCIVSGFMIHWANCEWWNVWVIDLWAHPHLSQAPPTHYTFLHSPVGWAPHARRLASHLLCSACIRTTLYTYYPVGDALKGATHASVSCHVWRCHVWCICHI